MSTKRRRLFLVVGIAATAICGLVCIGFMTREPRLEGRTIRSWLGQYESECVSSKWGQATAVFERSGSNAVPGLVQIINKHPSVVASAILTNNRLRDHVPYQIQSWAWNTYHATAGNRCWAIGLCGYLGPEMRAANPTLIAACRDSDGNVRRDAALAIIKTGVPADEAVRILSEMMLRDSEYDVRSTAAVCLGGLGEKAQAAIPALRQATNDSYAGTRYFARHALGAVENGIMMGRWESFSLVCTNFPELARATNLIFRVYQKGWLTNLATEQLEANLHAELRFKDATGGEWPLRNTEGSLLMADGLLIVGRSVRILFSCQLTNSVLTLGFPGLLKAELKKVNSKQASQLPKSVGEHTDS